MSIATRLAIAILAAMVPLAAHAGTFTTLYSFTGGSSYAPLALQKNSLYGVAPYFNGGGTGSVFKFDTVKGVYSTLYTFKGGTDGSQPNDVIYQDAMLYGTTFGGGSNGVGTVFAVDIKSGTETVLYSFTPVANGYTPFPGGLTYAAGVLYGVEQHGGPSNDGSIFAINLSSGTETDLYDFTGADGQEPIPSLIFNNGFLYGATEYGGNAGGGTVFSLNPATQAESTLFEFSTGKSGYHPSSNLVYHKGLLYGGTDFGGHKSCGKSGCGTAFSVDPLTGTETVLTAFTRRSEILIGLTSHDADLYEVMYGHGERPNRNFGELMQLGLKTDHNKVLYKFSGGADGAYPVAPLVYYNGAYYGTTTGGGQFGYGTIFQYVP